MLEIGSFRAGDCSGVSRRAFLRAGIGLPMLWGSSPLVGAEIGAPQAKSVLLVWLWGAPSHLDTCDPKPDAPAEYRGPFSTIATKTPGCRFSELLPQLASRSDQFSLIRSNRNFHSGHLEAGTVGLTGNPSAPPKNPDPNFGSIIGRHRRGGGDWPPFVSIGRGTPRDVVGIMSGYGGGKWGHGYDPFLVECRASGEVNLPALRLLDGLDPFRLTDRRRLMSELDVLKRGMAGIPSHQWNGAMERAYAMLTSAAATQAVDLSREPEPVRQAYGRTAFGQSCLLARRLIEARVPYVQVNWSEYVEAMTPNCDFGWDTHIYNFELLADRHCPIFDRAFSALLDDLRDRGLLDSTLVVCLGEFGRTPKINAQAARDHWPNVYFSIWSGGGVQPGRVIGASDRLGQEPVSDPVTPAMVGTTILEVAGVGTQARAELAVLPTPDARVIHELF